MEKEIPLLDINDPIDLNLDIDLSFLNYSNAAIYKIHRQLVINKAAKKSRLKKKIQIEYLIHHIKKLHYITINSKINNQEIINEILQFDKTKFIFKK